MGSGASKSEPRRLAIAAALKHIWPFPDVLVSLIVQYITSTVPRVYVAVAFLDLHTERKQTPPNEFGETLDVLTLATRARCGVYMHVYDPDEDSWSTIRPDLGHCSPFDYPTSPFDYPTPGAMVRVVDPRYTCDPIVGDRHVLIFRSQDVDLAFQCANFFGIDLHDLNDQLDSRASALRLAKGARKPQPILHSRPVPLPDWPPLKVWDAVRGPKGRAVPSLIPECPHVVAGDWIYAVSGAGRLYGRKSLGPDNSVPKRGIFDAGMPERGVVDASIRVQRSGGEPCDDWDLRSEQLCGGTPGYATNHSLAIHRDCVHVLIDITREHWGGMVWSFPVASLALEMELNRSMIAPYPGKRPNYGILFAVDERLYVIEATPEPLHRLWQHNDQRIRWESRQPMTLPLEEMGLPQMGRHFSLVVHDDQTADHATTQISPHTSAQNTLS